MQRATTLLIICCALLVASPDRASAQTDDAPAPFTMPDLVSPRLLDVELSYINMGFEDEDVAFDLLGFTLGGQFEVAPHIFVFGQMPMVYAGGEDGTDGEGDLGNLSVGARYITGDANLRFGGSFAVGLPTSPEPGDGDQGVAALLSSFARFDRFGSYAPNFTTLYLHAHVRHDQPRFFVQGQIGYEYYTDNDGGEGLNLLRAAVSAGYKISNQLALVGELTNVSGHLEEGDGEKLLHWLRGGARYDVDSMFTVGGHLYLALDTPPFFFEELRVWGLVLDLQARL